jgi:hypothetical protein
MRILLEQISSGRFLGENGRWLDHPDQAKAFEGFLAALTYAREYIPDCVGAYCAFPDPSYNFSVYLRDKSAALEWEALAKQAEAASDGELLNGSDLSHRRKRAGPKSSSGAARRAHGSASRSVPWRRLQKWRSAFAALGVCWTTVRGVAVVDEARLFRSQVLERARNISQCGRIAGLDEEGIGTLVSRSFLRRFIRAPGENRAFPPGVGSSLFNLRKEVPGICSAEVHVHHDAYFAGRLFELAHQNKGFVSSACPPDSSRSPHLI